MFTTRIIIYPWNNVMMQYCTTWNICTFIFSRHTLATVEGHVVGAERKFERSVTLVYTVCCILNSWYNHYIPRYCQWCAITSPHTSLQLEPIILANIGVPLLFKWDVEQKHPYHRTLCRDTGKHPSINENSSTDPSSSRSLRDLHNYTSKIINLLWLLDVVKFFKIKLVLLCWSAYQIGLCQKPYWYPCKEHHTHLMQQPSLQ